MNRMNTDIYLFTPDEDRAHFVDQTDANEPRGLCERFDITLAERPQIPTAQMRYDVTTVPGRDSSWKRQEGFDDIAISFPFNFISPKPRETYYAVANHLRTLEPGTRLRLSDDTDGTFRVLARTPRIEPLNNDLVGWGDFIIHFDLEPFRYIEQPEVTIEADDTQTITAASYGAFDTEQVIEHLNYDENATLLINDHEVYRIKEAPVESLTVDAKTKYTYGEEVSKGSGYPIKFYNNLNSIRMELEEPPFDGFNYSTDMIMPDDFRTNISGGYMHFDPSSHTVNVTDGGPESFLIFEDELGNVVEKPIHAEATVLEYDTTDRNDAENIDTRSFNIGFVATENQRFLLVQFANAFRFGTRVVIETENGELGAFSGQSGRETYIFENDTEITITIQDIQEVGEPVTHVIRTTQKGGEIIGTTNLNRYMTGDFPLFSGASNVVGSNTDIRLRPLWKFL